jgi:hypothetical protein
VGSAGVQLSWRGVSLLPDFQFPHRVVRRGGSAAVYGDGQSLHDRCRAMFRGGRRKPLTFRRPRRKVVALGVVVAATAFKKFK